jgi:hypothetical protein
LARGGDGRRRGPHSRAGQPRGRRVRGRGRCPGRTATQECRRGEANRHSCGDGVWTSHDPPPGRLGAGCCLLSAECLTFRERRMLPLSLRWDSRRPRSASIPTTHPAAVRAHPPSEALQASLQGVAQVADALPEHETCRGLAQRWRTGFGSPRGPMRWRVGGPERGRQSGVGTDCSGLREHRLVPVDPCVECSAGRGGGSRGGRIRSG